MASEAFPHPDVRTAARVDFLRASVARFAWYIRRGVNPMGKNDVCGEEAFKGERRIRSFRERAVEFFDFRGFRKRQVVTIHAVGARGHRGAHSPVRTRVTLGTLESQIFPVFSMAERNFFRRDVDVFGKGPQVPHGEKRAAHEKRDESEPEFGTFSLQGETESSGRRIRGVPGKKNNFLQNQIPSFLYFAR